MDFRKNLPFKSYDHCKQAKATSHRGNETCAGMYCLVMGCMHMHATCCVMIRTHTHTVSLYVYTHKLIGRSTQCPDKQISSVLKWKHLTNISTLHLCVHMYACVNVVHCWPLSPSQSVDSPSLPSLPPSLPLSLSLSLSQESDIITQDCTVGPADESSHYKNESTEVQNPRRNSYTQTMYVCITPCTVDISVDSPSLQLYL